MEIKNWHVNMLVRAMVLGSFVVGVKYADTKMKASNETGISMDDSNGSHVLDLRLNQLESALVAQDLNQVKKLVTGNGFALTDEEYKTFLSQFKTEGDAIRFTNAIRLQASDFAQGKISKDSYYFADGSLEDIRFKINHVTAELTFGTLGEAKIGDQKFNLNENRVVQLQELLPFNQTVKAKVDNTWTDEEELKIFNSFIGSTVKRGDKLVVKGRLFDQGAGIVVHIKTNADNGILYVNGDRSHRTVMAGGCYRDRFKEGDKIRVEFGGKRSKEFKVTKDNVNADLSLDLDEFMTQDEIKKEDHVEAKLAAKNFFRAVERCVKHGNTKELDDLMAPGSEHVSQQALSYYINSYERINFDNVYYNTVNTDGQGNTSVSATFHYAADTLEGVYMKADGAASIQLNADNKIVSFTIN